MVGVLGLPAGSQTIWKIRGCMRMKSEVWCWREVSKDGSKGGRDLWSGWMVMRRKYGQRRRNLRGHWDALSKLLCMA